MEGLKSGRTCNPFCLWWKICRFAIAELQTLEMCGIAIAVWAQEIAGLWTKEQTLRVCLTWDIFLVLPQLMFTRYHPILPQLSALTASYDVCFTWRRALLCLASTVYQLLYGTQLPMRQAIFYSTDSCLWASSSTTAAAYSRPQIHSCTTSFFVRDCVNYSLQLPAFRIEKNIIE